MPFRLFNTQVTRAAFAISSGGIIPDSLVEDIRRRTESEARRIIIDRTQRGDLLTTPDGATGFLRKTASTQSLLVPRFREYSEDRSQTRRREYARIMEGAAARLDGGVESFTTSSGREWVYAPYGYAQLRYVAGVENPSYLTMSFTGTLLRDLVVRGRVSTYDDAELAASVVFGIGGGKQEVFFKRQKTPARQRFESGFQRGTVASEIRLTIGFSTQNSWQVASWQASRYGNHFAALTPLEQEELRGFAMNLVERGKVAGAGLPRDYQPRAKSGRFIPWKY